MIVPEKKLLLLLSLPYLQKLQLNKINFLLQKKINWNNFYFLGKKQQVLGMVYYNLNKHSLVNKSKLQKFKNYYDKNIYKNLILLNESRNIFNVLIQEKINFIPLKGIYLIQNIYPSIGCRQLSDVDFYIKKDAFKKTIHIFNKLNYEQINSEAENHLIFKNKKTSIIFETHTELFNKKIAGEEIFFPFQWEELSGNKTQNFMGFSILELNMELHLLYLCFHLLKEYYQSYKWWGDLYGFLKLYNASINTKNLILIVNNFFLQDLIGLNFKFLQTETKLNLNLLHEISKVFGNKYNKKYNKVRKYFYGIELNKFKKFVIYYYLAGNIKQKIFLTKNSFINLLNY